MSNDLKIPCPTKFEVKKYLAIWDKEPNFYKPEAALIRLFKDYRPNRNISTILDKVYALNDAFGTAIFWQIPIAEHIEKQEIDEGLYAGDLSVVDNIKVGHGIKTSGGRERKFYSFATKYCSFHNLEKYPMFDSNVKRALICFKKNCKRFTFNNEDLIKYNKFVGIIENFNEVFDLSSSFRDVDKYLYLVGRKLNPNSPENKS